MIVSAGTVYGWLQEVGEGSLSAPLRKLMETLERSPCVSVAVPCRIRNGDEMGEWVQQVHIHEVL